MRRAVVLVLLSVAMAACAATDRLQELAPNACAAATGSGVDQTTEPTDPGEPFAGFAIGDLTPDKVIRIAEDAGLAMTWRFLYGTGVASEMVSECWCIRPPGQEIVALTYDGDGRLVVVVKGADIARPRAQPQLGWGC